MASDGEPLRVTFFPPLHHQRRMWILDTLRRERLTEIVDIGCGEGAFLATLCQPTPWLKPNHFQDDDHELCSLFDNVGLNDEDTPDLHATRIAGLDILSSQLEIAAQHTSPASINPLYTRWEPLHVELWQGSVDAINPAFIDVQCIVASELIEHLTDDILVHVAPIVLGVYRPRMFLVTTPSYTFNERWSPPGAADPQGYPDPTGRTNRVFRHLDHKFEWTVDEFVLWCKSVAQEWGYAIETATIGIPKEQDPWGRDGILGGASQVATFRRLDDHSRRQLEDAERRPSGARITNRIWHPSDFREIEEAMVVKFQQWREVTLGVQELWFADNLPILCGGSIDVMLDAAGQSTKLVIQRVTGQQRGNWKIQLVGELTNHRPEQSTLMETEDVMCEDDESDYDVGETSFDSGVHIGMTYDGAPCRHEDIGWTQVSSEDSWAANWCGNGTDTGRSEWDRKL
ncbi:hypothetical protein JVT61DRAFT_4407 [Boletus reticuloceps]|uniref:Small RNA 2'-O-methyltransferase n=1 Tax=Boletus reticuloceps TaxID=495285 RepID=A0A8I2YMM6_9AGAM|nr:hypothetical protein JVT61DRAFT_4407 [Boletus reticuloceps]